MHTEPSRGTTVGGPAYGVAMRGDRVEIVIDAGGEVRTYDIEAGHIRRQALENPTDDQSPGDSDVQPPGLHGIDNVRC